MSSHWGRLALASLLLLGIPAVLLAWAQAEVSPPTVVGLFALGPVAIIVVSAAVAGDAASRSSGGLMSALAGVGGILLLLPVQAPETARQSGRYAVVVLAVLVSAAAAVWIYRLLAGAPVLRAATVWLLANGLFLCAAWLVSAAPEHLAQAVTLRTFAIEAALALVFDLPQALLLLWLLRQVTPTQLSARYILVPLVTVVEGILLLRPEFTGRMGIGLALAGFGAWRLMSEPATGEQSPLRLS